MLNQPHDGSVFAYGLDGLNTYFRSAGTFGYSDTAETIRQGADKIATDKDVQDAVKSTGAEYLILLDQGVAYKDGKWLSTYYDSYVPYWDGLNKVTDETPGYGANPGRWRYASLQESPPLKMARARKASAYVAVVCGRLFGVPSSAIRTRVPSLPRSSVQLAPGTRLRPISKRLRLCRHRRPVGHTRHRLLMGNRGSARRARLWSAPRSLATLRNAGQATP